MAIRRLVHPRLMDSLRNHYPQTVQIQAATVTQDAANQPIESWAPLAGHEAIGAIWNPTGGSEPRTNEQTLIITTPTLGLRGYWPAITEQMRAVLAGVDYNIIRVWHDSQESATYLALERVE